MDLGFLIIASMPCYAAIDIGSNSVRLMVAEADRSGKLTTLAEDRQVTRLGESVFRTGTLSPQAVDEVCIVLTRMAASFRGHDPLAVRVVATSAVRDASNSEEFIERATTILGVPIEIISGQEEARLIHLGVETRWPHPDERILIVDIGGGSAEIIEAEGGLMKAAFSRPLGALRLQGVFLNEDPPPAEALKRMDEYIEEKLGAPLRRISHGGFARAIGTSASASAVVSAVNGIPRPKRELADKRRATLPQIRQLYRKLSTMDLPARRKVMGIGPRRAEIILPGAAVLTRVLELFQISSLAYCAAGVRDGLIRDLAERGVGHERTRLDREQRMIVEQFARRFGVDLRHARKVAGFAQEMFVALAPLHRLPAEDGRLLEAAAYLRDVGHAISDTGHHKHSQYIVRNADIAGFTDVERLRVSMLCRYHRKSMPGPRHGDFQSLGPAERRSIQLLAPLLRIADALDRSRDQRVEAIRCESIDGHVLLELQAERDTGLEQWAVEGAAATFQQSYAKPLHVVREA